MSSSLRRANPNGSHHTHTHTVNVVASVRADGFNHHRSPFGEAKQDGASTSHFSADTGPQYEPESPTVPSYHGPERVESPNLSPRHQDAYLDDTASVASEAFTDGGTKTQKSRLVRTLRKVSTLEQDLAAVILRAAGSARYSS